MSPNPPVSLDGGGRLRHGYTMVSLHNLARRAVFESRWQFIPFDEKHQIAWSAIAEELYSSNEQPHAHDLIRLAERAIDRHVADLGHLNGFDYHRFGHPPMPRYLKFWWTQPTPSPEDRIIDVIAFQQIWPRLNPMHQTVLIALAAHGDYQHAAAALDKPYGTFVTQIHLARKQFLRLWHEGEEPSGVWGRDRRKRTKPPGASGHAITINTVRRRARTRRTAKQQASTPEQDAATPAE
jgi:hypothetical protein